MALSGAALSSYTFTAVKQVVSRDGLSHEKNTQAYPTVVLTKEANVASCGSSNRQYWRTRPQLLSLTRPSAFAPTASEAPGSSPPR